MAGEDITGLFVEISVSLRGVYGLSHAANLIVRYINSTVVPNWVCFRAQKRRENSNCQCKRGLLPLNKVPSNLESK